jgi:hypothetical protein
MILIIYSQTSFNDQLSNKYIVRPMITEVMKIPDGILLESLSRDSGSIQVHTTSYLIINIISLEQLNVQL